MLRVAINNPKFSQLRHLIFNNNNTSKNTKRCESDIVQNLPVEILIKVFDEIISTKLMRICGKDYEDNNSEDFVLCCEVERILLRLTCKKWNVIIINLIKHADYDIFKIKKYKLEYVVPPPTIKVLEINDSRYLYANSCVLYNPYNWRCRLGKSGVNEWLLNKELKHVEKLYLRGCVDFTADGLSKLYDQLIDLSIENCSKITEESLVLMLKKLKNLVSLTINTSKSFPSNIYQTIDSFLPKLNNLKLIVPCWCSVSSSNRDIIMQLVDLYCLPKKVNNLTISQQLPLYDNHIFHILSTTPPPNTLKRLDVSNCFFSKDLFDIPPNLTHLTVSYPSIPRNTIKLPSTIEYLNISGYDRNTLYTAESNNICKYGQNWINMFPKDAPFLHTLILHLYVSPETLFPAITRFADTVRHLDCRILLSNMTDICMCEKQSNLGRQQHLDMIRELKDLTELKFYSRLVENEIEKFPVTLKKLWLINGFNNWSVIDFANRRGIEVFELQQNF